MGTVDDSWVLAANGERGGLLDWTPEFAKLGKVRDLFQQLSEMGLLNQDQLRDFIKANPYFKHLGSWGYPPLSREMEFGELSGFLPLDGDYVDARYAISSDLPFQLFVDADLKQDVIEHFDALADYLALAIQSGT